MFPASNHTCWPVKLCSGAEPCKADIDMGLFAPQPCWRRLLVLASPLAQFIRHVLLVGVRGARHCALGRGHPPPRRGGKGGRPKAPAARGSVGRLPLRSGFLRSTGEPRHSQGTGRHIPAQCYLHGRDIVEAVWWEVLPSTLRWSHERLQPAAAKTQARCCQRHRLASEPPAACATRFKWCMHSSEYASCRISPRRARKGGACRKGALA